MIPPGEGAPEPWGLVPYGTPSSSGSDRPSGLFHRPRCTPGELRQNVCGSGLCGKEREGPWATWKAASGPASSWTGAPVRGTGAGWHLAEGGAPPSRSPLFLCRMFFGKNKVMMVALGRSPADEYKDNLHQVGPGSPRRGWRPPAVWPAQGLASGSALLEPPPPHSPLQVLPSVGGWGWQNRPQLRTTAPTRRTPPFSGFAGQQEVEGRSWSPLHQSH